MPNKPKIRTDTDLPPRCLIPIVVLRDPASIIALLNSAREEVYSALALYQTPVRYVTTLTFSILTVIGLAFSLVLKDADPSISLVKSVEWTTICLLMMTALICLISLRVITRYYELYVSALLYASNLYKATGMEGPYWLERMIVTSTRILKAIGVNIANPSGHKLQHSIISRRTWSILDSHFWYSLFFFTIMIICVSSSILIYKYNPLDKLAYNVQDPANLHCQFSITDDLQGTGRNISYEIRNIGKRSANYIRGVMITIPTVVKGSGPYQKSYDIEESKVRPIDFPEPMLPSSSQDTLLSSGINEFIWSPIGGFDLNFIIYVEYDDGDWGRRKYNLSYRGFVSNYVKERKTPFYIPFNEEVESLRTSIKVDSLINRFFADYYHYKPTYLNHKSID